MFTDLDQHYMRYALSLAKRGLGRTAPNPSVGCVIVNKGRVVGAARTADSGRPHAEPLALAMAGDHAHNADVYVTLEPCSHFGATPPCAQALIDAGVARVFVGCIDDNPAVSGAGIAMLEQSGVDVYVGLCESEALAMHAGFFLHVQEGRPFVTLKTALTIDGKIALGNGDSQWITGSLARRKAHHMRAQHDAILCGIGTVNADDPLLTCRVDGLVHKSVRIVLDTSLSLDVNAKMVRLVPDEPLWVFHDASNEAKIEALTRAGVRLFQCDTRSLDKVLQILSDNGVRRLLVEGGAELQTSFLRSGLFDMLAVFTGAKIFGSGFSGFKDFGVEAVADSLCLQACETLFLGHDQLTFYKKCKGQ